MTEGASPPRPDTVPGPATASETAIPAPPTVEASRTETEHLLTDGQHEAFSKIKHLAEQPKISTPSTTREDKAGLLMDEITDIELHQASAIGTKTEREKKRKNLEKKLRNEIPAMMRELAYSDDEEIPDSVVPSTTSERWDFKYEDVADRVEGTAISGAAVDTDKVKEVLKISVELTDQGATPDWLSNDEKKALILDKRKLIVDTVRQLEEYLETARIDPRNRTELDFQALVADVQELVVELNTSLEEIIYNYELDEAGDMLAAAAGGTTSTTTPPTTPPGPVTPPPGPGPVTPPPGPGPVTPPPGPTPPGGGTAYERIFTESGSSLERRIDDLKSLVADTEKELIENGRKLERLLWFRRPKQGETDKLEARYVKAVTEYNMLVAQKHAMESTSPADTQEHILQIWLAEEERLKAETTKSLSKEVLERYDNGRWQKAKNWLKRHPMIRATVGFGLLGGSVAAMLTGNIPLGVGLKAAGTFISTEGIIDNRQEKGREYSKAYEIEELEKIKASSVSSYEYRKVLESIMAANLAFMTEKGGGKARKEMLDWVGTELKGMDEKRNQEIIDLLKDNPNLTNNQIVTTMLRASREQTGDLVSEFSKEAKDRGHGKAVRVIGGFAAAAVSTAISGLLYGSQILPFHGPGPETVPAPTGPEIVPAPTGDEVSGWVSSTQLEPGHAYHDAAEQIYTTAHEHGMQDLPDKKTAIEVIVDKLQGISRPDYDGSGVYHGGDTRVFYDENIIRSWFHIGG